MIDPMSDDELIRELKHWGEREYSVTKYKALNILRRVSEKRQSNIHRLLVLGVCMAAFACTMWLIDRKRHHGIPGEVAIETLQMEQDPQQLLQSIATRTQDIAHRVEGIQSRFLEQQRSAKDLEVIQSAILKSKRAAVRNQIVLSQ